MVSVPVLCFHKITNDHEWGVTTYSPKRFAALLELLHQEGFEFCLPNEVAKYKKPLIITFDDAYQSVLEHALPILKNYQSPSVIFPIINYIGKLNTWDANLGGIQFRHLGEEEIEKCLGLGAAIGSHGLRHRAFSLLTDSEIDEEIKKSFAYLKNRFKIDYRYFAGPFGELVLKDKLVGKIDYSFNMDGNLWDGKDKSVSRIPVYSYETPLMILKKINKRGLINLISNLVHFGAKATVLKQKISGT